MESFVRRNLTLYVSLPYSHPHGVICFKGICTSERYEILLNNCDNFFVLILPPGIDGSIIHPLLRLFINFYRIGTAPRPIWWRSSCVGPRMRHTPRREIGLRTLDYCVRYCWTETPLSYCPRDFRPPLNPSLKDDDVLQVFDASHYSYVVDKLISPKAHFQFQ